MKNPARFVLVAALFSLVFAAAPARADIDITLPLELQANGLPRLPVNGQLFRPHGTQDYFVAVQAGSEQAWNLYVVWTVGASNYYWVTGADRRPILPGSKVQGWRLRQTEQRGRNWYVLDADGTGWKRNTERRHDGVWRNDPYQGRMQSERPPADWENYGGELDPLPVVEPIRCEMMTFPRVVPMGESVRIVLISYGRVTGAYIDGANVTWPRGDRVVRPDRAGSYRVHGTVRDGNDRVASCSTDYVVERKVEAPKPTCEIQVNPAKIHVGQFAIITFSASADAREAKLDGVTVDIPMSRATRRGDAVGRQTLSGTVKTAEGVTGTCSATLEVEP